MARVVSVGRGLLFTFGAMVSAATLLSACDAFLDDFVYVDAGEPTTDGNDGTDGTVGDAAGDAVAEASSVTEASTPADAADGGDDAAASATYAAAVIADGPVAYWRLGEAVGPYAYSQTGGAANTAKYTGDISLGVQGAIAGDPDTAMRLDGQFGSMVLPGGFPFVASPLFAVELWIRPTDTAGAAYNFVVQALYGNVTLDFFYEEAEEASLHGDEYRGSAGTYANSNTDPAVSAWSYLVFQSDGIKLTVYLNANPVPIAVAGLNGMLDAGDAGDAGGAFFTVGGNEDGYNTFKGDIDEVAVYQGPLTPAQMQAHYALATPHDGGL